MQFASHVLHADTRFFHLFFKPAKPNMYSDDVQWSSIDHSWTLEGIAIRKQQDLPYDVVRPPGGKKSRTLGP